MGELKEALLPLPTHTSSTSTTARPSRSIFSGNIGKGLKSSIMQAQSMLEKFERQIGSVEEEYDTRMRSQARQGRRRKAGVGARLGPSLASIALVEPAGKVANDGGINIDAFVAALHSQDLPTDRVERGQGGLFDNEVSPTSREERRRRSQLRPSHLPEQHHGHRSSVNGGSSGGAIDENGRRARRKSIQDEADEAIAAANAILREVDEDARQQQQLAVVEEAKKERGRGNGQHKNASPPRHHSGSTSVYYHSRRRDPTSLDIGESVLTAKREGFSKLKLVPVAAEAVLGVDTTFQHARADFISIRSRLKKVLSDEVYERSPSKTTPAVGSPGMGRLDAILEEAEKKGSRLRAATQTTFDPTDPRHLAALFDMEKGAISVDRFQEVVAQKHRHFGGGGAGQDESAITSRGREDDVRISNASEGEGASVRYEQQKRSEKGGQRRKGDRSSTSRSRRNSADRASAVHFDVNNSGYEKSTKHEGKEEERRRHEPNRRVGESGRGRAVQEKQSSGMSGVERSASNKRIGRNRGHIKMISQ